MKDGIYLLLKGRRYGALRARLAREADPDRALRLACRELALEEIVEERNFAAGYPDGVEARADQILDRTRARMEAAGGAA